jgi:hypothetical protein
MTDVYELPITSRLDALRARTHTHTHAQETVITKWLEGDGKNGRTQSADIKPNYKCSGQFTAKQTT